MFMRNLGKIATFLSATLAAITVAGGIKLPVTAAKKSYEISDLIKNEKIKLIGRSLQEDNKLEVDFGGSGFEFNIKSEGERIRIVCETNEVVYLAAFVDGELKDRESAISNNINDLFVDVPAGEHTVRIIRDTQIDRDTTSYFRFLTIETEGKFGKKPAETENYFEVIGDSIACGDGALGVYQAGKSWKNPEDHSAVKSFAYVLSEKLGWDCSIVARGGIGLLRDTSGSQESADKTKIPSQDIYPYALGYKGLAKQSGEWDFKRRPNFIVIELGGNDSTEFEDQWKIEMEGFIKLIREKNGSGIPIIWMNRNPIHYATMQRLIDNEFADDKQIYAFQCTYGGSGSAALATQKAGHPSSAEQAKLADDLLKYLTKNEIVKEPEKSEPTEIVAEKKNFGKKAALIGGGAAAVLAGGAALFIAKRKKKK